MAVLSARGLQRMYAGAPEGLARALATAMADTALPRVTRRELARLRDALMARPPQGVGVVAFPVVDVATGTGRVYRVLATEGLRGDWTPLHGERAARVHTWITQTWPALEGLQPCLHVSGPAPGDGWEGASCDLALALATLSWALGITPAPVVVTGALGPPGQVAPVDHHDAKRALVAADLPDHTLLTSALPLDDVLDAALPGWREALGQRAHRTLARRAHTAVAHLLQHRHGAALVEATAVLDAAPTDEAARARALWVRGAVALHQARAEEGLADLAAARAHLPGWHDHPDDPPEELAAEELAAWEIIALIDAGRPAAAADLGHQTLHALDATTRATRRWRSVALQVAGSTHRALITLDRSDEAERLLRGWSLERAALLDQRARALGDLAELQRRQGNPLDAQHTLDAARRALADAIDPAGVTARFLDLFQARLDAARGRQVAPPRPGGPLWPELGFEVLQARRGASLQPLLDHPAVRASQALQWVVASEIAWHVRHDGPAASLLPALQADVATWTFDDPGTCAWRDRLVRQPVRADLDGLRRRAPYG